MDRTGIYRVDMGIQRHKEMVIMKLIKLRCDLDLGSLRTTVHILESDHC